MRYVLLALVTLAVVGCSKSDNVVDMSQMKSPDAGPPIANKNISKKPGQPPYKLQKISDGNVPAKS